MRIMFKINWKKSSFNNEFYKQLINLVNCIFNQIIKSFFKKLTF